ncbi:Pr6Pr family membrane protein [Umezawaea endophytica]|uniref:Pr6Pr family membrane protein n=1 Tax=Umezawaea endophytica TaxID=1654476 RepID=A0A9X2VLJ1_9PSEU|nr:Pr6Pr family membrane protein [Umezawaea endophytica]MCS7478654.1 Pr6Pr family membrane protein [Umezawaea endophytica]
MDKRTTARLWFGATALVVLVGLVVQMVLSGTSGRGDSVGARLFTMYCFFTVQSNVIVCVTTGLLAANPNRPSTVFRVFRLAGLVGIAVTGIVFHLALAGLQELQGYAALADFLLHTASPLLTVVGWLLFGPRAPAGARVVLLSLVFPLAWLVFTLVRGPFADFYPYPFLDVRVLGYPAVLVNCVVVGLLFGALAAGAVALDRVLTRATGPAGSRSARSGS